ncbi:MAG: D-alanyl-D-alanine carboxypeptidase [Clostridia bacterium]|nr:D-alanyl-D-alanine carboxypeptidase [Clostridia bacterium]
MKKRIIALFVVLTAVVSFDLTAFANIGVSAQSAILMCADNGEILFSKNAEKQLSMASTTKIMTSLIALEASIPDKEITVTNEMVSVEGTSMGLVAGDSVSMEELVYGMLLQSGNDAANTVAHVLGGGQEGFAKLMNARAAEIGMKNTNFVTASGLDDKNHYSTAYDMALLACECIENPEFAFICSQKKAKLTYGNPPYARTLTNHNRLLWKYSDTIGIKTGFTKKSGRCLVSAAERNGVTLVAVTLNASDDWNDHISMFEYGFSKLKGINLGCDLSDVRLNVAGGDESSVSIKLAYCPEWLEGEDCKCRIMLKPFEYAPIKKDSAVGEAVFISEKGIVDKVPLLTADAVFLKPVTEHEQEQTKGFLEKFFRKIKDFLNISEVK